MPAQTAAEAWFGLHLPELTQRLDTQWAADRAALWHEWHLHSRSQRERQAAINARQAAGEALTDQEAWEQADLTEDHVGTAEALPLLHALAASPNWGAAAKFATGRLLLSQDEAAGLDLVLAAMAEDTDLHGSGLVVQQAYYERQGNWTEARRLGTQQLWHADAMDGALTERNTIDPTDTFVAHDLPDETLANLRTLLAAPAAGVSRAWLLRKELLYSEKPLFVLVVLISPAAKARTDAQQQALVQQLANQLTLLGKTLAVTGNTFAWLEKRALSLPGSEIMLL